MDRRAFLAKVAVAGLSLAAIPIKTKLQGLPTTLGGGDEDDIVGIEDYNLTEQDILDLNLNYAESWQEYLPNTNVKELILKHLVKEKTGLDYDELRRLNWKKIESGGQQAKSMDDWEHHAMMISAT